MLVEVVEDVAIFEGKGSTLARVCLPREKNEEECAGIFEVLDAEDAMGGLGDGPTGIFSFDSALPGCFADLKPNAPREAIVAAWLAKHLNKLQRWRTWATYVTESDQYHMYKGPRSCTCLKIFTCHSARIFGCGIEMRFP